MAGELLFDGNSVAFFEYHILTIARDVLIALLATHFWHWRRAPHPALTSLPLPCHPQTYHWNEDAKWENYYKALEAKQKAS